MIKFYLSIITLLITGLCFAGTGLIINVDHRNITSLGGKWNIIIDPYELGYYDYRHLPDRNGFFKNQQPKQKWDRIEYSFDSDDLLNVPGDWNSQQEKLFLYEGSLWYKKSFTYSKKPNTRVFLYFGAVNYIARVFLNGKMLGEHEGGFTPFVRNFFNRQAQ